MRLESDCQGEMPPRGMEGGCMGESGWRVGSILDFFGSFKSGVSGEASGGNGALRLDGEADDCDGVFVDMKAVWCLF